MVKRLDGDDAQFFVDVIDLVIPPVVFRLSSSGRQADARSPRAKTPEEVSERIVQAVRSTGSPAKIVTDPALL